MNPLIFYNRLLFIIGLFCLNLSLVIAQNSPVPLPRVTPMTKVPTLKNKLQHQPTDIAKSALNSYYKYQYSIQKKPLSRKYYTENVFDIGAYDNPFALQKNNRKTTRTKHNANTIDKNILADIFALSGKDNQKKVPQWLIFVLLGIVSFMTMLFTLYKRTISTIIQAFFSLGAASNMHREQQNFIKIQSFSSYLLFTLSMGTFIFILPRFFTSQSPLNTFGDLLLCILGTGAIYTLKHLQLQITSIILPYNNEIRFYSFIIGITNKIIAYFLVPSLFLLAYVPSSIQNYILYLILTVLTLIYIYRSLRSLGMVLNIILFHKFHFFVYLCTIEIAPVIILLKLLSIF